MQSARLELARLTKDHLPGYFSVRSNWEVEKWHRSRPMTSIQEAEEHLLEQLSGDNRETFAILLRDDLDPKTIDEWQGPEAKDESNVLVPGGFVGYIGVYDLDHVAQVFYVIHRSAWGFGIGTEALLAFTELFWMLHPDHYRLLGRCDPENVASGRVLENCGFEYYDFICADEFQPWMVPQLRDSLRFVLAKPGYTFD
ncbi:GNAT domain-containing protein [Aspergillus minisclerotigenes]|uniref:GNAT domain-containing protein n=1 Tax=Aspergillus minisclerotigenes TaxID=656917 RepID=A0A5N6JJX9_9EURO|nr:GNAT domain-containing protein [Aspergillus minisclerotigenes]